MVRIKLILPALALLAAACVLAASFSEPAAAESNNDPECDAHG